MKVKYNEDGTVTVRLLKTTDEVYDPADGQLYVEETMDVADLKAAVAKPKKTEPEA